MDEKIKLDKDQIEMLRFLKHTSREHTLDLDNGFDLGNKKNRTTLYKKYLLMLNAGLIKGTKGGHHWITEAGLVQLPK